MFHVTLISKDILTQSKYLINKADKFILQKRIQCEPKTKTFHGVYLIKIRDCKMTITEKMINDAYGNGWRANKIIFQIEKYVFRSILCFNFEENSLKKLRTHRFNLIEKDLKNDFFFSSVIFWCWIFPSPKFAKLLLKCNIRIRNKIWHEQKTCS